MVEGRSPAAPGSPEVLSMLDQAVDRALMPERMRDILTEFHTTHREVALGLGAGPRDHAALWLEFVPRVIDNIAAPHRFSAYAARVREPVDHHRLGRDFWRPVVDWSRSLLGGRKNLARIDDILGRGQNIVLVGNHQTEPDPYFLSLLLAESHPELATEIVYVAGDRVLTDPVAIPFSMGCNLLCVYSQRHIDHPPEQRGDKRLHNRRTMTKMGERLSAGGCCLFVAPSGGRDRRDASGALEVAPLDPNALATILLVARRARTPTSIVPLALSTHAVFPPPPTVEREIGERRVVGGGGVRVSFGEPIALDDLVSAPSSDRGAARLATARALHGRVRELYSAMAPEAGGHEPEART